MRRQNNSLPTPALPKGAPACQILEQIYLLIILTRWRYSCVDGDFLNIRRQILAIINPAVPACYTIFFWHGFSISKTAD
jgi:hypothetical protein